MPTSRAQNRAIAATIGFGIVGIIGAWLTTNDFPGTWPLQAFFALIVVNTYYSVRCFSDIHGADGALSERIIDALLVAAYLLLAFQFGSILRFVVVTTTLFVIATLKYTFLLGPHDHARILQRKIILDTLCTFACLLALAGVLAGWALLASAIWFFAFVIGNIYILLMSDIYKPISR